MQVTPAVQRTRLHGAIPLDSFQSIPVWASLLAS